VAAAYTCAICGTRVKALGNGQAGAAGEAPKTAAAHRYRPFCSARCQRIDLGNWLGERYVVPGPPSSTDGTDEDESESGD
jgi:endogenous inhibitor of DNA gyrase (YacG/DUF329 family)